MKINLMVGRQGADTDARRQSIVSLTFDDGLRCQFERAVPILNQYEIRATFFLIANQEPTHESWFGHENDWRKINWGDDDITCLRELMSAGHEIGSHGLTHRSEKILANPVAEAGESKTLIEGWLGTEVTSFCYPYYRSDAYFIDAVRKAGYEQARGGANSTYYGVPCDQSFDRFNLDCRQISDSEDVGGWLRPRCWHILTFHAIGSQQDGWKPISSDRFAALMGELANHRDAGDVEIVTFRDGAARLRLN